MEAKIALALLLSRFRVHLADQTLPPAWAGITLRPQGNVPIRLERRKSGTRRARQLQKLGHHTAMISPFGQRHAAWHFYAGFNEIHNTGEGGMESAEVVQPVVDKWLAENAGKDNWYLHINYWDPHTPYRVPGEYDNPFANDPLPAWLDDDAVIARHVKMTGPHTASDIEMYTSRYQSPLPALPRQNLRQGRHAPHDRRLQHRHPLRRRPDRQDRRRAQGRRRL